MLNPTKINQLLNFIQITFSEVVCHFNLPYVSFVMLLSLFHLFILFDDKVKNRTKPKKHMLFQTSCYLR